MSGVGAHRNGTGTGCEVLGMEVLAFPVGYLCHNQPFSFFFKDWTFNYMYVCVYPTGPKVLDPLELKLQVIMSH